jgi:hypothetical protein
MRAILGMIIVMSIASACGGAKDEAIEEARRQQEAEAERRKQASTPVKTLRPPVTNEAKLPCAQVINLEAFQTALDEKEPLTVKDVTAPRGEAAASCDLVRGGKPLTEAEQQKLLKDKGRLGILAGDIVCNVRLLCYTLEDHDKVRERCAKKKFRADETMGSFACVQVVATGVYDVDVYEFFDEDTKCVFEIRGGPSNTDNDLIRTCAKTARDTIGPAQIAVSGDATR